MESNDKVAYESVPNVETWQSVPLSKIVEQLEFCDFRSSDTRHYLKTNVAFQELKRRAGLGMKNYDGAAEEIDQLRIYTYELSIQSGDYHGVLYDTVSGNIAGLDVLESATSSIENENFEKVLGAWEKHITPEQLAANDRHGVYEPDEDGCIYNCHYKDEDSCPGTCGLLKEVVLFNAAGEELGMDIEDVPNHIVGVRIVGWKDTGYLADGDAE